MKKVIYTILLVFFSLFTAFGIMGVFVMISESDSEGIVIYSIWSLLGFVPFLFFLNKRKKLRPKHICETKKPEISHSKTSYKNHTILNENQKSPKEKKSNVTNKKQQYSSELDIANIPRVTVDDIPELNQSTMEHYDFKVVGVTFKTGRKSRQTALRQIYFHDEPYETADIELKEYEYEGEQALGVFVNDFQVGNIAKKDVRIAIDLLSDGYSIGYTIYGGGDKNWGMSIKLSKEN